MTASTLPLKNRRILRRSSLRTALFLETLALLGITVVIVSTAAFALAGNELTGRVRSQLQSIAQEKAMLLETTVSRQREQLSILGHDLSPRSISALTDLVGFKKLFAISAGRAPETLQGSGPDLKPELLAQLAEIDGTVFRPVVTDDGWTQYVIATPLLKNGVRDGTLAAVFDATSLASRILHAEYAGNTAEVLLSDATNNDNTVLRFDEATARAVPVLGSAVVVNDAFTGDQGVASVNDYAGIPVLEAYRAVPTLGWAVIAKIDRYEVTSPVTALALEIAGMGLVVILFLSLSTFALARRIIGPLEELTRKLDGLETRHWRFSQTIATGNELEIVDAAAADLTERLRTSYEHLEDIVRDRTEDLRKEHAEDQAVLQSMDDGLVVTDDKGIVTYMNPMAATLTGYAEGVGKPAVDVLRILTKEGQPISPEKHPVSVVLRSKTRFAPHPDPQFTLVAEGGRQTPLQLRATPILRGKKSYGAVLVIRDIAEERRIDHMKSEFISLVSHQLRTPLSAMRWYLEMLISQDAGPLTADQKEYVEQVASSNARMVHLVNALLNVSRIELGRFSLSPETIDLAELTKTVVASFDLERKQKNVTINVDLPKKTVGARSDKGLLVLILENLVSNAVKYSPANAAVLIGLSENTDEKTATLTVKDIGIGIPETQQKDIGRKLFRATNARTTDTDGNGLGLYISHVAAESIGADLTFESGEGKGTTFSLTIPLDPKKREAI